MLAWQTLDYLREFAFARQAVMAGVLIATASAALSSIVVLKRLAFVGQGISHAAFGGIGVVAILGLAGFAAELVIFAFCLASALLIAGLSRARTREDTAIGIVLVATMALGFMLLGLRQNLMQWDVYREFLAGSPPVSGWDAILFGSIMVSGAAGVWMSAIVAGLVLLGLWWWRRPLMTYVFDEKTAEAAGVSTRAMRGLLLVLLALVVVVGMKVVGVVLVSALLVLPGAIAAQLCQRLVPTLIVCWVAAILGVLGGLVASLELSVPPGPAIVLVLVVEFAMSAILRRRR
ncbi:MAG TPA: metal ABC transporter permease [Phycisphaerales bacterium]|nr:metal ABC transporter permease [Phycisphaerales bacterium]HRQ76764.1 metal ABC transporter permease [Phycisphaerales bacterium]